MHCLKSNLFFLLFLLVFQSAFAQTENMRSFIFGHSLLDHRPPAIPTPSDETTVPHWMYLLAQAAGKTYAATGQYGFLPQHANLPPDSQWGYDIVPTVWDASSDPFSEADFNNILLTAGNFMQWQAPNLPYPGGGGVTPISATETIVDWVDQQEPNIPIYIYENWPDMAPYLSSGSFPPSASDMANYNAYTNGAFHDWWIEFQDSLLLSRPGINIRMIPVGPIIAGLLTDTNLDQIPLTDLYEDDAPHGRPTIYFLASLVTYMATFEMEAPAGYTVPSIVHSIVQDEYATVVDYIWTALQNFNDSGGNSRVFFGELTLPVEFLHFAGKVEKEKIELVWATASERNNEQFEIEFSVDGNHFETIGTVRAKGDSNQQQDYTFQHEALHFGKNYYRLKQMDFDGQFSYSKVIQLMVDAPIREIRFYPNPTTTGQIRLAFHTVSDYPIDLSIYDATGRLLQTITRMPAGSNGQYDYDLTAIGKGLFFIKLEQAEQIYFRKIRMD